MPPSCPHQVSNPSDGNFLAGHCPQCLLNLALHSANHEVPSESADSFSFTPGTILGDRFRLISLLGRGGMGEVYRADDLRLGQPVALKFLPSEISDDAEAFRRLTNEVRLGRQVAHPNVCRLYDLAEADGQHFIVMELIDGENLASLLARIGRLPGRKAMEVAADLCAGLAACHDREVIHGDLKPGNVMIDGSGQARITDFGLSTISQTTPQERLHAGTLPYIAPEQLHGTGPTAQADIYALGLILYEMFTGRRAHDVRTVDQLRRLIDTPPVPPSTLARVPSEVEEVILRCLERKPARRPRSAAKVATAFPTRDPIDDALAAGGTPSPMMVAASQKVGDLSVRMGWSLLGTAIFGLLLAIAGAQRFTAVGRAMPLENPEVLANRAREIAASLTYPLPQFDQSYGFTTRMLLRSRAGPRNSTLAFFYRQSSHHLTPIESLRRVGPTDPPLDAPGMLLIGLEPNGSLRYLRALPPEKPLPGRPVEWRTLFEQASLDPRQFTPTFSDWTPSVPYHNKQTWVLGPSLGDKWSIRAALHHGYAVYFDVTDDLSGQRTTSSAEADRWTRYLQTSHAALLLALIIAAALLARRNTRLGQSDLRGARRVAGWVLICRLLYWALSADHIGSVGLDISMVGRGFGQALFESMQVWLAYLALEPFIRRRWPRLIIGWNRLIDGRFIDPLVGRDLMIGGVFGILLVLVEQLRDWSAAHLALKPPPPHPVTLEMLSGAPEVIAAMFYCQARALIYAFLGIFMFLLLRAIVKRPAIAGTLWILAAALTWSRTEQPGTIVSVALAVAVVQAVLSLLAMVRYGLLAGVMMYFTYLILVIAPLTYHLTSWYGTASSATLLILLALLGFGFRTALARKPLFGHRILEA